MWLALALVVAPLAMSSALDFQCPPGCDCSVADNLHEYECDGLLVGKVADNSRAEIDCGGRELDCSKLPRLAMGSRLDKLEVSRCRVADSLACALSALGASGVDILIFRYLETPVSQETVQGLDLRQLWIYDSGVQSTVPLEAFKAQPNITKLIISGGGPFHLAQLPPSNLTYLDISSRTIPRLEADLFAEQRDLVELRLWKNEFEEIDVNAFRGLESLQVLDLNGNPLRSLPAGSLRHSPALRQVILYGLRNRLEELQPGVFSGLQRLESLCIENAEGVSMRVANRSLADLPSLQNLTLSADVQELPADVFRGTVALLRLDLKYNQLRSLPDTIFQGMINLVKLDLTHNRIENITGAVFAPLKHLQEIRLEYNRIVVLPPLLFTTDKLEVVNLSHNRVASVHENSIAHALTLDLSHNRLAWGAEGPQAPTVDDALFYVQEDLQSPLSNLGKLRELNLSHNQITRVFADWTWIMVWLRRLDLSYNNITELNKPDVTFLGSDDLVVDIRHNQITYISMFVMNTGEKRSYPYPTLKLGNNPYNCDCTMYDLLKNINNPIFNFDADDASCAYPLSLRDVELKSVATDLLTCEIPDSETPNGCDCVSRPALNRTECTCQEMPDKLPDPTHSGFEYNMDLTLKTYRDLRNLPKFVKSLNLSDIGIDSVPYIPNTVAKVDLSNNKIIEIPLVVLERNLTLYLSNNPIDCDCGSFESVDNLQKYIRAGKVKDDVKCRDGRELEQVDVASLCSVLLATMLGGIACAFAIITSLLALFYYKYSIEIKVWLYKHGWDWLLKEESLDADKSYDVFLSYAHKDEKFITEMLLPQLDIEYKVCVHTRDFIPGEEIATQIYRSVSESRRTLIVFSSNFLNSLWGIEEFRAAYLQGLNDRRVRAIVILFGDIDMENLSDDIKTYLSLTTYVKWGDAGFWDKLRYALPRKVKAKDVRLKQRAEIAAEKLSKNFNSIVVEGNANKGFDHSKIEKSALNVIMNEDGKLVNKGYVETKTIDDWKVL